MEPRISIVTLGVADVEASTDFYANGLGLPLQPGDEDATIAFFETEGVQLALYPRVDLADDATVSPAGAGFRGVTLAHNVASREAVDATLDEARAASAEIVKPAAEAFWGGYSGYFADPDGHLWEVAWNPYFDLD